MRLIKTGSLGTAEGSRMSLRLTNDYKPAALSPNSEKGRENKDLKIQRRHKKSNDSINLDGELRKRSTKINQKSESNSQILTSHI